MLRRHAKTNDTGAPLLPDPVSFAHDLPELGIGQLPTRGLASVNVYSQSFESKAVCHDCGSGVDFYVERGMLPDPPDGWPCPECGEWTLAFRLAEV